MSVVQHGTQAWADKKREYLRGEITWRAALNWLCWAGWHPTDAADYLEAAPAPDRRSVVRRSL
jgi:hypothetical protein